MSGRESSAVQAAVAAALAQPTATLTEIARQYAVALSSLRRALRRRSVPARPRPYTAV